MEIVLLLIVGIYLNKKLHDADVDQLGDSHANGNIECFPEAKIHIEVLTYRFCSSLNFANVEYFRETLGNKVPDRLVDDLHLKGDKYLYVGSS